MAAREGTSRSPGHRLQRLTGRWAVPLDRIIRSRLESSARRHSVVCMRALILPIALLSMVGFAVSTACTATLSVAPVTFAAYGSCGSDSDYAIVTGDYADYCGPGFS